MDSTTQLNLIKKVKAIADTGLVYAQDPYDRDRYTELREIGTQLLASVANTPLSAFDNFFMPVEDYPTAKVDVRGFVLNKDNQVLMAKESVDQKWTIPGGWADVGFTPSEVVVKEIEEETGIQTEVVRLLAIYDKRCHPHPPQPFYIYKLIFLCKEVGGSLEAGFDMKGAQFFNIDELPELSEDRILKSQLEHLYTLVKDNNLEVYVD